MALYLCNQLFIMCSMVMKMNLLSFRLLAMAACVCFKAIKLLRAM